MTLKAVEERIEALEARIGEIDEKLLDPAVYEDGPQCKALRAERARRAAELAPLEAEWARRAEDSD